MTEEWRAVVGFEGQYEVSNLGRVRSLDRAHTYSQSNGYSQYTATRRIKGRLLSPTVINNGYPSLPLGRTSGTRTVHALVLEAFVGPRPAGMECRHLNGDKSDASLKNLKWGTSAENAGDKHVHDTQPRGERVARSKLKAVDISIIRKQVNSRTHADIAMEFGVSRRTIGKIAARITWRHL